MDGLELSRVAEVIVDDDNLARHGSGYRVTTDLVLTAEHVVRDAPSIRLRFNADRPNEWITVGTTFFADRKADVALVTLQELNDDQLPPAQFGRIGRRAAIVPYQAVGFPLFKLRAAITPEGQAGETWHYRDTAHVQGVIPSLSNRREDTLEIVVDPPGDVPDRHRSPWEGMSGAAVWCGQRIVGVISKHYRDDGLNRLTATPLTSAYHRLEADRWSALAARLGLPSNEDQIPDVIPPSWEVSNSEGYAAVVREIAPEMLFDRDEELSEITRFCAGDQSYQWWQADPWCGKTALMSWLVLHPPGRVRVVSFFITRRLAGQADSGAFTAALIEQLAVITGEPASESMNREGQRIRLLNKAAEQVDAEGDRLLLVIDGLDENRGRSPSIASLLPRRPPKGLRVLVTSRPQPDILADVPADHPLWTCPQRVLARSKHAQGIERSATIELKKQLNGDDKLKISMLGFLVASGGGLTLSEFAGLTKKSQNEIGQRLESVFGRSLGIRNRADYGGGRSEPVHIFGHEALREIVEQRLVDRIGRYRKRIDEWVKGYQTLGWPETSPRYVFRPYALLLQSTRRVRELAAVASDWRRHDEMQNRTFGDMYALEEIHAAHQMLLDEPASADVAVLVMLAFEHDRLARRSNKIPHDLPSVWAHLGWIDRALSLARSINDQDHQAWALTAVAKALGVAGDTIAAERIARTVSDQDSRDRALMELSQALATAGSTGAAERIARNITDEYWQLQALDSVAGALSTASDTVDAARIARDAEQLALSITDQGRRAWALTGTARTLATIGDSAGAARIACNAEKVARSVNDNSFEKSHVLAEIAKILARAGETIEAERIARTITDQADERNWFLGVVSQAFADAGHTAEAELIARDITDQLARTWALSGIAAATAASGNTIDAERIARTITDQGSRATTLTGIAQALAAAGHAADAERIACDAEDLARGISDNGMRAQVLSGIALALATVQNSTESARIARDAEQAARGISGNYGQAEMLNEIVQTVALAGQIEVAERVAHMITHPDPSSAARALYRVAQLQARTGNIIDAERIVRTVTHAYDQAGALIGFAQELSAAGRFIDAIRIAHDAEHLARTSPIHQENQAQLLTGVAQTLVTAGDKAAAERVAKDAEYLARTSPEPDMASDHADIDQAFMDEDLDWDMAEAFDHLGSTVSDQDSRTQALTGIALASASDGHVADAERLVRAITGRNGQAQALTAIARTVAIAGDAVDAARIVDTITEQDNRDRAWMDVGQALAATDHTTEAERVVSNITDQGTREWALSRIAEIMANAGQAADAERIASSITDENYREDVLTAISCALANAGDIAEAERVARTFTDQDRLPLLLIKLARILTLAGHISDALRIARDTVHLAHTNTNDYWQAEALTGIIEILATADHKSETDHIVDQIKQLAYMMPDPYWGARVLAELSQTLANAGQTKEAEPIANSITDRYWHLKALTWLAEAFASAGHVTDTTRVARASTYPEPILSDVAKALVAAGRAADAERITGSITHPYGRARTLMGVSKALAAAGRTSDAERLAQTIDDDHARAQTLIEIAQNVAAAGHATDAARIALDAERVARGITDIDRQSRLLAEIAQALTAAGHTTEAKKLCLGVLLSSSWAISVVTLATPTQRNDDDWIQRFSDLWSTDHPGSK